MKNKQLVLRFRSLIPCVFFFAGIFFLQTIHLNKISHKNKEKEIFSQEEQSIKVFLDVEKNIPSFGFDNIIANWNFLNYIQYFGDEPAREKTGYSLIPEFFENIVNRDPLFIQAYLQLSTANSIYAARPDRTVALMNRVLQSISPETSPLAPFIWIYKGVDEILFLGDLKTARHSYEMASKWASIQGNEFMANRTRETVQFLASNPDSKKAQISAWVTILTTTPDQKTQQYALDKIKSLGAEVTIAPEGKLQIKMPEAR
jgi:hypothetical protein